MGKLSHGVRDKIIEVNDVDHLFFEDVISYFRKKYKEDSYKELTRVKSFGGEKAIVQGRVTRD